MQYDIAQIMAAGPRAYFCGSTGTSVFCYRTLVIAFQSCIGMNDITVHQFTIGNINFEQHHLLSFPILSCKNN